LSKVLQGDHDVELDGWQKRMQDEITKKIEQDKETENRKCNVVIYKVHEVVTDNVSDRTASDLALLTEMLDTVFGIKPETNGVAKAFRLGRRDDSKNAPRPLLVEFSSLEGSSYVQLGKFEGCNSPL